MWSDVPLEEVGCLPWDIDGTTWYKLTYDQENRFSSSKDGRLWQKSYNSDKGMFMTEQLFLCWSLIVLWEKERGLDVFRCLLFIIAGILAR